MGDRLWMLIHVVSNGLFAGGLLAMLLVQSLLQRALDDAERRPLARAAAVVGRVFVSQSANLGFLTGFAVLWSRYAFLGAGKVMACAPVYVHIMLGTGFLSLGLVHAWAGRARRVSQALDGNMPFARARGLVTAGWIFGLAALLFAFVSFTVAIQKMPNPPRTACVAPPQ